MKKLPKPKLKKINAKRFLKRAALLKKDYREEQEYLRKQKEYERI